MFLDYNVTKYSGKGEGLLVSFQ